MFLACPACARCERGRETPEATTGLGTVGVSETLWSGVCQAGGLSSCGHLVSLLRKAATANLAAEHRADSLSSGSGAGVQRGPAGLTQTVAAGGPPAASASALASSSRQRRPHPLARGLLLVLASGADLPAHTCSP